MANGYPNPSESLMTWDIFQHQEQLMMRKTETPSVGAHCTAEYEATVSHASTEHPVRDR